MSGGSEAGSAAVGIAAAVEAAAAAEAAAAVAAAAAAASASRTLFLSRFHHPFERAVAKPSEEGRGAGRGPAATVDVSSCCGWGATVVVVGAIGIGVIGVREDEGRAEG